MGLAVALGFRRLSNLSLACYPSLRSACPHVKSTSPPSSPLFYPIPSSHVPQSESLSGSAPSVDVSLTSASSLPLCGSRAGLSRRVCSSLFILLHTPVSSLPTRARRGSNWDSSPEADQLQDWVISCPLPSSISFPLAKEGGRVLPRFTDV